MFKALNKAFIDEIDELKGSFYKLFLVIILPVVCFGLIISIFKAGVVRDLPIAVVDNDKSNISRKLLFNIQSSPTLKISKTSQSAKDALLLMQKGDVYGVIIIPNHFSRDVLLGKNPKVSALLNTQYILIGKIITSALNSVVMSSSAEVEYVKNLSKLKQRELVLNSISPISMQVTPFFNIYQNYFLFLVSALIPSIWQIFIVMATIISFGSMFKQNKQKLFFSGGYMVAKLIGKMLPYTFIFSMFGVFYLFYIYGTLGWVFQGSFALSIFALFLTTVAYQMVALLFFAVSFDYARTLSIGAVYTAPAFAFLGVTFPASNMNEFSLFWRDLLPISHYMELQISQANYDASIFLQTDKLLALGAFCLLFIPASIIFKKRLSL
jgi:ABC-2 type transport system permease protein